MRRLILDFLAFSALSAVAWGQAVPRPSGEFALQTIDGRQVLLSQFRGKVVLLEFVFTTCPHCQTTSMATARLNTEYGPRGFQPLGVAFNDGAGMALPEFIRAWHVNYPMGLASRESVMDFLKYTSMSRLVVPQAVVIDRKGVIRAQSIISGEDHFTEEPNLRAHIEKLLNEPAAGARAPARKTSSASSPKGTP